MPGSRKFTSNLHEISHLICVTTSGSCLENSSDFKHCFELDIESTVEPGTLGILQKYSEVNLRHATVAHLRKLKGTFLPSLFVSQRNISRGYLVRL